MNVTLRDYVAAPPESDARLEALDIESQAALRQFSLERIMGYGVSYSDAVQLRERVLSGERWLTAASSLADACLSNLDDVPHPVSNHTRIRYLRDASALRRMSQMMMLSDTADRQAIYADAAVLYKQAAELSGDREAVTIHTAGGPISGWLFPAQNPIGSAIVFGGIEGYAMDFDSVGEALAIRGIDALLIDVPGQGETRFTHGHYFGPSWLSELQEVVSYLDDRAPGRPIGVIGNSMGGSLALLLASTDSRISACINNGGIPAPGLVPPSIGTFFTKMTAFCDAADDASASKIWGTVTPLTPGPNSGRPLLVLHGGADALVTREMADFILARTPSNDKRMVVFSDGIHCIYNHLRDRDIVMADWTLTHLSAAEPAARHRTGEDR